MPAAPIVQQDAVQQDAVRVLKDVIASLARKQRRLFHHTWELLPDLQHMLLIGSKYTRQFQIALLQRVAEQEAYRMEMAAYSSRTCHFALGQRADSSMQQYFYHDSQKVQNLISRLRILVWTNGCLESDAAVTGASSSGAAVTGARVQTALCTSSASSSPPTSIFVSAEQAARTEIFAPGVFAPARKRPMPSAPIVQPDAPMPAAPRVQPDAPMPTAQDAVQQGAPRLRC